MPSEAGERAPSPSPSLPPPSPSPSPSLSSSFHSVCDPGRPGLSGLSHVSSPDSSPGSSPSISAGPPSEPKPGAEPGPPQSQSDSESPQPVASLTAADVLSRAVAFAATAPPEQLMVVAVSGAAVLYLFLGQLGLLVVGVAVGVVGHATLATTHAAAAAAIPDWLLQARSRHRGSNGNGDTHSEDDSEDEGPDALQLKVCVCV